MRRRGMVWAALAWGILGCESAGPRDRLDQDPLLVSRRPVERKAPGAPPDVVARAEPAAPALPAAVRAAAPKSVGADWGDGIASASKNASEPPATPTAPASPPLVVPAARPTAGAAVTGTPAVRRRAPGRYGHAPDHAWLQGVLRRRGGGRVELRFADESEGEPLGGVVLLESDRPLDGFADGAAVVVEGELIAASARPAVYRVRAVAPLGSAG